MFISPLNRIHFGADAIASHLGPSASISGGASPGPTFPGSTPPGSSSGPPPVAPPPSVGMPGPGQSPVYGPGGNMGNERPPSSYGPIVQKPFIFKPQ
jgi:hypothetical protein